MDSLTPALDQALSEPSQEGVPSAQPMQNDQPVNVLNPNGKLVSVPQSQIESMDLFNNGYSPAQASDLKEIQNQKDYGGLGSQINAAVHNFGTTYTLGAFPLAERAAAALTGQDYHPEAIAAQNEANPFSSGLGTGAGLTFGGVGPLLEKGVMAGAKALAPAAAPLLEKAAPYVPQVIAKIGSTAAKAMAENALFQGIDETGKMLAGDPGQTTDTMISNLKMSALIGGGAGAAFGTIPPLWKATFGSKATAALQAIADHAGGIEGKTSDPVNQALDLYSATGKQVPEAMRSVLSESERAQQYYKDLRQSPTPSGTELAKTADHFRNSIGEGIADTLGKTSKEVQSYSDLSHAKEGGNIANKVADEFETKVSPLAQEFEDLKARKANMPLLQDRQIVDPQNPYLTKKVPGITSQIADQLGQLVEANKWAHDSDSMKIMNQTLKRLPEQNTIGDLGSLATRIQDENYNPLQPAQNRDVQQIVKIFRDAESNATLQRLGEEAPEFVARHQAAREAWSQVSDLKSDLQSKLNLKGGNQNSNGAFIKNLRANAIENPEKFLKKISNPNDVYLSKTLAEQFPETAQAVKDYQTRDLLGNAAAKAAPGQTINPTTFFNKLDQLSPELRQYLFPSETMQALEAHRTLWDSLNTLDKDRNFSNTAPTLMRYLKSLPGTALGLIVAAMGHNPIIGAILGSLTNAIGRNAPDAMKLAFLKFMGESKPIDAGAFKTMVDFFHATAKGENALSRASKELFQTGRLSIPQAFESKERRDKFDEHLSKLQQDPTPLFNTGGSLGHYMPDHATSLAQTAASNVNYLNSLRPQTAKMNPLDTQAKPSAAALQSYHNALDIAEQPLSILPKIQNGTLNAEDMKHFIAMYPGLHARLGQKLLSEMTDHLSKGNTIPYAMRMGLSLFGGQPLDSTMTPQGIQATQQTFQQNVSPTQPSPRARGGEGHSMKALSKLADIDQLPSQARQAARAK